jgi:hypothetical protein
MEKKTRQCYRAFIVVSLMKFGSALEFGISNLKLEEESGFSISSAIAARSSWTMVLILGRCLPFGSTLCMAKSATFHMASKLYWPPRSGSTISSIVPACKKGLTWCVHNKQRVRSVSINEAIDYIEEATEKLVQQT